MNFEKIYVTLFQYKDLVLKIHVKLLKEKDGHIENFHQVFTYDTKSYLKLDLQSFLTLEIKNKEDGWDKNKVVLINTRNIFAIIKGFKKIINNIYHGGVFALDKNNEIVCYADKVKPNSVEITYIGGTQRILLEPAVIYDAHENYTYEGCVLSINNTSNYIEMPTDILESLFYTLSKIDMFAYSMSLLNYYVSTIDKLDVKNSNTQFTSKIKQNIFAKSNESIVESNLDIKKEEEDPYFKI